MKLYAVTIHRPNACTLPFCNCDWVDTYTLNGRTPEQALLNARRQLQILHAEGVKLPPLVVVTHPEAEQW